MPALLAALAMTSWRAPWSRVWINDTGEYVLSIAPDAKTKGWALQLASPGADAGLRTMWRTKIDFYPSMVFLSGDGHLVTANEYPGYSNRAAVVVFGDDGKILNRYVVTDLMAKEEFEAIPGNEGLKPKRWVEVGWYDSLRNLTNPPAVQMPPVDRKVGAVTIHNEFPLVFRLRTVNGKSISFDLVTGKKVNG